VAKVLLVVAAGVLGAAAIGATFYTQRQIVVDRTTEAQRQKDIRERLGTFISEGLALTIEWGDNNKPVPRAARDVWLSQVMKFLEDRVGHSYVVRLFDPAGVPIVACNGANKEHNEFYRVVYAIDFHLEKFSEQSNFYFQFYGDFHLIVCLHRRTVWWCRRRC
jgi:hypothetical protein